MAEYREAAPPVKRSKCRERLSSVTTCTSSEEKVSSDAPLLPSIRRSRRSTKKRVAFSRCTGIIQVAER